MRFTPTMRLTYLALAAALCSRADAFTRPVRRITPLCNPRSHAKLVTVPLEPRSAAVDSEVACPGGSCPIPKFRGKLHRNVIATGVPRYCYRHRYRVHFSGYGHQPPLATNCGPAQFAIILPFAALKLIKLGMESQSHLGLVHAVIFVLSIEVHSCLQLHAIHTLV